MQVRIVDVIEHGADLVERALHGPLGIDPFIRERPRRAPDQDRIVEHQQLRVEDGGEVGAARLAMRRRICSS